MKTNYEEQLAQGESLCDLALEHAHHGRYPEALEVFQQAEEIFLPLGHTRWLTFIQHERLGPLKALGRDKAWQRAAELAKEGYREQEDFQGLCLLLLFLAHQCQEAQEDAEALCRLREAELVALAEGCTHLLPTIQARLAVQLLLLQDYAQAAQKLQAALQAFAPETGERYWVLEKLALTYRALFLFPRAEEAYLNAIEGYLHLGETNAARETSQDLLDFYQKAGRKDEAESLIKSLGL